jgi:hypothetical protein
MTGEGAGGSGWEEPAGRRSRWPAVVVAVALVAVVRALLPWGGDDGIAVEAVATPAAPDPAATPDPPALPAPDSDATPRGAARNPDWWPRRDTAGTWVSLPPAGIAARTEPVAVWTGGATGQAAQPPGPRAVGAGARPAAYEPFTQGLVLVWGGYGADGPLRDGAAYDPFSGVWRRIPPAPHPWAQGSSDAAVWTGRELLTLGAVAGSVLPRWMAYDPAADRWRETSISLPAAHRWHGAGWTGTELVVLSTDGAAAYDPEADTWRTLPPAPVRNDSGTLRSATLPGGLAVLGLVEERPAVTVLSAGADAWTAPEPMPAEPGVVRPAFASATVHGSDGSLLLLGADDNRTDSRYAWAWSPGAGWQRLPDLETPTVGDRPSVAHTGQQLLAWLGDGRFAGAVLSPDAAHWRPMAAPPLSRRWGAGVAWTGQTLVVWGGVRSGVLRDDGALFVPD